MVMVVVMLVVVIVVMVAAKTRVPRGGAKTGVRVSLPLSERCGPPGVGAGVVYPSWGLRREGGSVHPGSGGRVSVVA